MSYVALGKSDSLAMIQFLYLRKEYKNCTYSHRIV